MLKDAYLCPYIQTKKMQQWWYKSSPWFTSKMWLTIGPIFSAPCFQQCLLFQIVLLLCRFSSILFYLLYLDSSSVEECLLPKLARPQCKPEAIARGTTNPQRKVLPRFQIRFECLGLSENKET